MRRHETDPVSFTAGLLFLGIGLTYLLPEVSGIEIGTPWVIPALLIGLGLCGLLAAFAPRPRPAREAAQIKTGPQPYVDYDPEPFPDLTLDLAEELAKTVPVPAPAPRTVHAPTPPVTSAPPPPTVPSAQPTAGGAHAINPDTADKPHPLPGDRPT